MARVVGIGLQDFSKIQYENIFYVDKTRFIKEWWESKDEVTLITRPRRFGKTLTMSMVEQFFSVEYAGNKYFQGMDIWKEKKYQELQGSYPVISLTFSSIKEKNYEDAKKKICATIQMLYQKYRFLIDEGVLSDQEKEEFLKVSAETPEYEASLTLKKLSAYLNRYYGKNVILLLDEYDTPMQEAYVKGYWQELADFIRNLLNATFKDNPYLARGIMTGITRISRESIFSDLNHLKVVTTTSNKYADCFGFTEEEVFNSLKEYGLEDRTNEVKKWYDGFCFGKVKDIYNPWSILNYLDNRTAAPYWVNTSSNHLIGKLLQEGNKQVKESFEKLLRKECIYAEIDEQIVYDQLDIDENAIWSLMLASGYLKVNNSRIKETNDEWNQIYELSVTNFEVLLMLKKLVRSWFAPSASNYNEFIKALLQDDIKAMNLYMNRIALSVFSFFDTEKKPSAAAEPERFYHGFVLGLIVDLEERYRITSNRESGFGRYDIMLEPKSVNDPAIIIEFKIQDPEDEKNLSQTVEAALQQIDAKNYAVDLLDKGIPAERIRKYGFAFCGKTVLIGNGINS
ncbi:MAG TPA: ATP-binding protein [Candidatus Mediterraneibacter vanvlietii]|nr:ATP-binding protein [Candidatus Mediterraneibacter vanvlietii]